MGNNMSKRLLIMIGVAVVLVAAVVWRWGPGAEISGGDDGDLAVLKKIEKLVENDDHEALVKAVSSKNVKSACRAISAMRRVGPKAIKGVRAAMADPRPVVREAAVIAMDKVGGEADTPNLATVILKDESPDVRAAAALSLGRMKAYTELEALLKALEDDDQNVRSRANTAIVTIFGVSASFSASGSPAKRERDIAALRKLCKEVEAKTREFYENRRRYRRSQKKD